jgi:hypothetical protein
VDLLLDNFILIMEKAERKREEGKRQKKQRKKEGTR